MLTDYISCYKINYKREKKSQNFKIAKLSMLLKIWGIKVFMLIMVNLHSGKFIRP